MQQSTSPLTSLFVIRNSLFGILLLLQHLHDGLLVLNDRVKIFLIFQDNVLVFDDRFLIRDDGLLVAFQKFLVVRDNFLISLD